MGTKQTYIFLHAFAFSSGVSESNGSVVFFERCPGCGVDGLSTLAAIEMGKLKGKRGRRRRKNSLHGSVLKKSAYGFAGNAKQLEDFFHSRVKSKMEGNPVGRPHESDRDA